MLIRTSISALLLGLSLGIDVSVGAAQNQTRCEPAQRFLVEEFGMETRVDRDTLDDWRTGKRLEVCQVTAAGVRLTTIQTAARR